MTLKRVLCIFLFSFLLGSCGDDDDKDTSLVLEIPTNLTPILPVGNEDSCFDTLEEIRDPDFIGNSIAPPRAQFTKIILKWFDDDRILTIYDLTLIVRHPQLTTTVVLTGDEVNSIFGIVDGIVGVGIAQNEELTGGNIKQSFQPDPENDAVRPIGLANCRLNFGSLGVDVEEATSFTTGATIEVRGIAVKMEDESDPRPVSARVSVRLSYTARDL